MQDRELYATPLPGFLVEPRSSGPTAFWEGHHATNPCAIRLSRDPRVFLGYRAGGTPDFFRIKGWDVWRSHLGMAVLNETGDAVTHRLPLPILEKEIDFALPQTEEEFEIFKQGPHAEQIAVLHDFRLWEDGDWLYCIYHEGALDSCFDCIVRMPVATFLAKIERSCAIMQRPLAEIRDPWREMWWADDVWQPAGVNGTNRIYPSALQKNDIVFLRVADGGLRMLHRPVPDIAILDTRGCTFAPATPDGITEIGSLQSSIRPGRPDNSHIGNNGMPTPARIGQTEVYVDVVHGVQNYRVTDTGEPGWDLEYRAYFRVLDHASGELLYYSEDPIFPNDDVWRMYTRDGAWVSRLPHLRSVMFAGGQVPAIPGRIGLDDAFHAYIGVGDTAVALARFTPRQLLPDEVIADIRRRSHDCASAQAAPPVVTFELDERVCGWRWVLRNSDCNARVQIVRQLDGTEESNVRAVYGRPGHFDADGLAIEPSGVRRLPDLGWAVVYRGWRQGQYGYGLLLLDRENPERILYRSTTPIAAADAADVLRRAEQLLPENVRRELRFIYEHQPLRREMVIWLADKARAAGV